jgi:type IV secretory pathway VirB2 component (pilin)
MLALVHLVPHFAANAPFTVTCAEIGNCAGKVTTIDKGFTSIVNILTVLSGSLAVLFIIYSGIQMTISNGDPKRVTQARQSLIYSVVGLVLVIAAYAIVSFIAKAL